MALIGLHTTVITMELSSFWLIPLRVLRPQPWECHSIAASIHFWREVVQSIRSSAMQQACFHSNTTSLEYAYNPCIYIVEIIDVFEGIDVYIGRKEIYLRGRGGGGGGGWHLQVIEHDSNYIGKSRWLTSSHPPSPPVKGTQDTGVSHRKPYSWHI